MRLYLAIQFKAQNKATKTTITSCLIKSVLIKKQKSKQVEQRADFISEFYLSQATF